MHIKQHQKRNEYERKQTPPCGRSAFKPHPPWCGIDSLTFHQ